MSENTVASTTVSTGNGPDTGGSAAPAFYISVNGSDSGDGTIANPFQTLARAQQAMQDSTVKTAEIEGGNYSIGGMSLNSSDSGESWLAYQGATVTIDGNGSGYIDASGTNNLTIEGLTFDSLGVGPHGGGLYMSGSNETIRGNTILNSDQEAITGANLDNSLIDSNTISGVSPGNPTGSTATGFDAMEFWFGSSGNTISHNSIENAQGGGISFSAGPSDPTIDNNIIDSNKLVNVDTSTFDNGAIYIMDRTNQSVGNKITNNVVNGYGNGSLTDVTKGIYLDDGASNVQITGNLLYGTAGEWGMQFNGGSNNVAQNNIFALQPDEQLGLYQSTGDGTSMSGNDFQNNIVYYASQPPSSLWHMSGGGVASPNDTGNLYYAADGSTVPNNGVVDSNPFTADLQFQDAGAGNFSMPAGSAAYTEIGWNTLATDQGPIS